MNRTENTRDRVTIFYAADNQDEAELFASLTVDEVTAILAAGADPNERDEYKVTPLHWIASDNEEPAVIAALLAADTDLQIWHRR